MDGKTTNTDSGILLQLTEELTQVGTWELHLKTNELFWSAGVYRMLGYEPGELDLNEDTGTKVIHPEDRKRATRHAQDVIEKGIPYHLQKRLLHKNGDVVHVLSKARPLYDEENRPERLLGVFQNITEQVRIRKKNEFARKELQKSERRLKALIQEGADTVSILDEQGHYTYASPNFPEITGHNPEELMGQSAFQLIHPEDVDSVKNSFELLQKQKRVESEAYRFKCKSGEWIWMQSIGTNLLDDEAVQGILMNTVDVTNMIGAREELAKSNERFRLINKAANEAIYEWDIVKDEFHWGEGIRRIFGHQFSNTKFTISDWRKLMHPADTAKLDDKWEYFLTHPEENRWHKEFRFKKGDGTYAITEEIGHLIRNEDGEPIRMIGAIRDVTKTRELQNLLDNASKLAKVGSWEYSLLDDTPERMYWSPMTRQILELDEGDEFTIADTYQFFNEEHRHTLSEATDALTKKGREFDLELPILTKNKNRRWVRLIGKSERLHGRCLKIYGSIQDIHKRKQAEEEIRRTNERFEKVTRATNDAIWDYDTQQDVLFWGNGFKTLFGYDPKRIHPTFNLLVSLIHPDDRDRILLRIKQYMNNPESTNWYQEYRFKKSDGDYAYVIDRAVFIRDKQGAVIRVVGAMTDITHRKVYENSLHKLNKQLEQRTKELEVSNAELEQFAYVASHDLQEPLRMVSGFMSRLQQKYGDELDEKAQTYIRFAVDGAKRMRNIIRDLLEFSKVSKPETEPETIDTQSLMDEVCRLQASSVSKKQAHIHYKNLPVVESFLSPLRQVFQNLVSNALKYSEQDEHPQITIEATEHGDEWEFSIADNGIGIEEEHFERIFVIFQRLHNAEEYGGTGMGLTIVKKIIDNLGGRIWVESEPGAGSTFYFTIPKTPQV